MPEEIRNENIEDNAEENTATPDFNEKMELNTDFVELNGVTGQSFFELRDKETYGEFLERTSHHTHRNAMFLWHCYKQSGDSWTAAYRLAPQLTCLGAICANDWLADMDEEEFEDIADFLPYDDVELNVDEYENLVMISPFFAKYSAEYGETLQWLINQFPDQGADWALETIYDETRKTFATSKILGKEAFEMLDAAIEQAKSDEETPAGTYTIGIADVNDEWWPISMLGSQVPPEIKQAQEMLKSTIQELSDESDDEELEHPDFPDDENLELLWLQAYIWADRSWTKAEKIANDIVFGAMSYAAAMFAPPPDLGELTQDERAKRLEEIAEQLRDENGNVALRVDETKKPIQNGDSISYPLDEISSEFMKLLNEQERFIQNDTNNQNAVKFSSNLPACHDNIHGFLIEDIVDYLSECEGKDEKAFENDFNALSTYLSDRTRAISAPVKSKWKKYLKSNPDAAAAAKRREVIVQVDDEGNPIFIGQVSHADIGDPADVNVN